MSYEPDPNHPLTTAYPYFPPEEQEWLSNELREIMNGQLAMGPRVARFEKEFAAYCDVPYAVAFPSCTSSMEAALRALGVGPGDEVLVPVETFIATGMVVSLVGARPVFTEISSAAFSMDLSGGGFSFPAGSDPGLADPSRRAMQRSVYQLRRR